MASNSDPKPVGTIYLPQTGTPVGTFNMVTDPQEGLNVEIGSVLTAVTDEGIVTGVVSDMSVFGDHVTPRHADLDAVSPDKLGQMPPVRLAEVKVIKSERLRPVGSGIVRQATGAELRSALGEDTMAWKIPMGTVSLLDGTAVPVCVDGEFVAGPEGQGLLVYGRSGVASKTSFMTVALKSLLSQSGPSRQRTAAALVVNVKGEDLVWLDQPPEPSQALQDTDYEIYKAIGAAPEPFSDVTVHAPRDLVAEAGPASARSDALPLAWDLEQMFPYINLLEPDLYTNDRMMTFVSTFQNEYLSHSSPQHRIDTFRKFNNWLKEEIADSEDRKSDTIMDGRVHRATAQHALRKFEGLRARGRGLFTQEKSRKEDDIPVTGWKHGQVRIIDLARLSPEVQGFVIARTVDRLLEQAEGDGIGVDHLVVVTDELNQWAPSGSAGEFDSVRRTLRRLASQGRYSRICLFGAAQAASKINEHVRDNSVTKAVGSSSETELVSGVHGRLGTGQVEKMAALPKGQTVLWHPSFRQPVNVAFPRPAWRMGRPDPESTQAPVKKPAGRPVDFISALRTHIGEDKYDALGLSETTIREVASAHDTIEAAAQAVYSASEAQPTAAHAKRRPASALAALSEEDSK